MIQFLFFFFFFIQDRIFTLTQFKCICVWNSLLEIWTLALTPHIPQALILVEWPPHQGCAVVFNDTISIFVCCFILFLISFLWLVIWMASFKGLVRHFNLFSINWSLGCVSVCIVNLDFIYLHRFDVMQFTYGDFIKANLILLLFFNHSVLFPLLFSFF